MYELSQSRQWLKLLHYPHKNAKSEITNPSFFFSEYGNEDSLAELKATIKAMQLPFSQSDLHAICRFPARYLFLAKAEQLNFELGNDCESFNNWRGGKSHPSIKIIYADGYMGNPASFYGHLLFKVDDADSKFTSQLLSQSLNFGAKVPDDENPAVYIIKGLIGGYDATYTSNHFYRHNINYAEVELRDLWSYELDLTNWQTELLIAHAWEMLSSEYTYYFTHRNCAYHVAKMLEVVFTEDLINIHEPFVLPITVFNRLSQLEVNNKSIFKDILKIESRQNRFRRKYLQLDKTEKKLLTDWVSSNDKHLSTVQQQLKITSEFSQKRVLDTLIDYFEFRYRSEQDDALIIRKNKVLRARFAMPAGDNHQWEEVSSIQPHLGQNPSMLRTKFVYNSLYGSGVVLQARPAYYDFLSQDAGHLPNSQLSMFDLSLRITEDKVALDTLDLLNIETLNISPSHLPGDGGIAWKLRAGIENNYLSSNINSKEWFIESGIGRATIWGEMTLYAMGELRLQTPSNVHGQWLLTPNLGFLYENGNWKTHCKLSYPINLIQSTDVNKAKYSCEQRMLTSSNYDLRFKLAKHLNEEMSISFSYYL